MADSQGTWAARPTSSSGANGDRYLCTDAPIELMKYGGNWNAFYEGYPVKIPDLSLFTANSTISDVTVDDTHGVVQLYSRISSDNLPGYNKAVPAAPYSVTMGFLINAANNGAIDDANISLGFYNATSGNYRVITIGQSTILVSLPDRNARLSVVGWGSDTSLGTKAPEWISKAYNIVMGKLVWMQIQDDGSHMHFLFGLDPFNLFEVQSVAYPSGMNPPSHFGFYVTPGQGIDATIFHLDYGQGFAPPKGTVGICRILGAGNQFNIAPGSGGRAWL